MGCQNQNGFWKVFVCECDLQDNWAQAGQGEYAPRGMTVSATGFGMSELKKGGEAFVQSIIPTQHRSLKEVGKFLRGGPKVAQCRVSEPKQWGEDTSAVEGQQ